MTQIPLGKSFIDNAFVPYMEEGLTATEAAEKYWTPLMITMNCAWVTGILRHNRIRSHYEQIAYSATEIHEAWAAKHGPNATHPDKDI